MIDIQHFEVGANVRATQDLEIEVLGPEFVDDIFKTIPKGSVGQVVQTDATEVCVDFSDAVAEHLPDYNPLVGSDLWFSPSELELVN